MDLKKKSVFSVQIHRPRNRLKILIVVIIITMLKDKKREIRRRIKGKEN